MSKEDNELSGLSGEIFSLSDLVEYQDGTIVSRTLVDKDSGTMTAFALDEGQTISEHTTPYDALLQILDGAGTITISGEEHYVESGRGLVIPKGEPHSLKADERFKMLLVMIK